MPDVTPGALPSSSAEVVTPVISTPGQRSSREGAGVVNVAAEISVEMYLQRSTFWPPRRGAVGRV